ncbi:MAG: hypothetical protein ALECFALPRED_002069 [Alectoria fallacina]|uniref:Uncharacterized protein n=1 Tax=Alectoria fallacina TaxID=1903189 RepID=A0A8H3FK16_9LECA|nr:MAG: hypothetical protein ALECFALPRED_002069 [Alectoria fallacina]
MPFHSLLPHTQIILHTNEQTLTELHLNPLLPPTMRSTPTLTLVLLILLTAATAAFLLPPPGSPPPPLRPRHSSFCDRVTALTKNIKELPVAPSMASALLAQHKLGKVNKALKCSEGNWADDVKEACHRLKEIKLWLKHYWTGGDAHWGPERKGIEDDCVALAASVGCPAYVPCTPYGLMGCLV